MDWIIAVIGIVALIALHEFGHFAAAKALGMHVEKFSVFFPPAIAKVKLGDTEYALGAIPLGGYVKVAGMTPKTLVKVPPEFRARAYCNMPPWRRAAVLAAGPLVNLVVAFALFAAVLAWGDVGGRETLGRLYPPARPTLMLTKTGQVIAVSPAHGLAGAVETSAVAALHTTGNALAGFGRAIESPKERRHMSSIIGVTRLTEQAVEQGTWTAVVILGYVSLLLGVVNLLPFLPLDGGHVVWSIAEKVRGKRVPVTAMWAYSSVGLALLLFFVANGFNNDIARLAG